MPSPTQHFENLGAPLRNMRWSWGAQQPSGTVILRAWDDERELISGRAHIRLTNNQVYGGGPHPGFRERLRHIESIRQGAPAYVIICTALKPTPQRRRLKSFDHRTLTKIVQITDWRGDQWAELGEVLPVEQLRS